MNGRECFRANYAWGDTHNVQVSRRMSTRSQVEPVHVRMQFQQLLGRCCGHEIGPGLVDLFNDIERSILNGMKSNRIKFHALEHIERVATLRGNPVVCPLRRTADGIEQTICIIG